MAVMSVNKFMQHIDTNRAAHRLLFGSDRRLAMYLLKHSVCRAASIVALTSSIAVGLPRSVLAQEEPRPNVVLDVVKDVLFDPTTYAPATLSYTSQRMDWNSSQVLFRAGWMEHNWRYTVSGRPDDRPISYEAGNRQIRMSAVRQLQESLVNNVAAQIFERALAEQHPNHRKLFKTLSWVERISFSAYI